jgi:cold shock CspA family protein
MQLQVNFRDMVPPAGLKEMIHNKAAKLERFAPRIIGGRVVVEPAGKHHLNGNGNLFQVHIDITLPNDEIVATRVPGRHAEYEDVAVAVHDAFDVVARQLEDHVRRQRGAVKVHRQTPHARVSRLLPAENHGFLAMQEGREIYFHRNSVLNDAFDRLQIGTEVAFIEEEGEKGPQASTIKIVDKA